MGGQAASLNTMTKDGKTFYADTQTADKDAADNAVNTSFTNNENRPDLAGPYGTTKWNADGTGVTQQFSGPMGSAANSLQQNYADALRQPLNGDTARTQAVANATGLAGGMLGPQWATREQQMKQRLQSQGVDASSPQYAAAMGDLNKQKADAYSSAKNMAIGRGAQDSASIFRNGTAEQLAGVQQMQQMMELLRQPKFNLAQKRPELNRQRIREDANNYAIGQAANASQSASDTVQGGTALANSLANLSRS